MWLEIKQPKSPNLKNKSKMRTFSKHCWGRSAMEEQ